jgi:hypothetical protein
MSLDAGWYVDPSAPGRMRWWDGTSWTATTAEQPGSLNAIFPAAVAPATPQYGAAQPERWTAVNLLVPMERAMATRALVWGILSIPFFIAFPVPILALVFGIVGVLRAGRLEREGGVAVGRARSIAGIVLGGIGVVLFVAVQLLMALYVR